MRYEADRLSPSRFACDAAVSVGVSSRARRGARGPEAPLGIYTELVDAPGKSERKNNRSDNGLDEIFDAAAATKSAQARRGRWADQAAAGAWLPPREARANGEAQPHRVALCKWTLMGPRAQIAVSRQTGRAAYRGLMSCGSAWTCPVCSQRISQFRREEMNHLLRWGRRNALSPVMLTLTTRHSRGESLASMIGAIRAALQKLRQSRRWRDLPIKGTVVAVEMTHGENGWHPHFHLIALVQAGPDDALALMGSLRAEWRRSLRKVGRDCGRAGFDVQDATAAGDYIAKGWGAGEELTLDGIKSGRGRSPAELLRAGRLGDQHAKALWLEYAAATKGRAQLNWSRGLKAEAGVAEVSDEAAARDDETGDGWLASDWDHREWIARRRRRVHWLEDAERRWKEQQDDPPPRAKSQDAASADDTQNDQQDEPPNSVESRDTASTAAGTALRGRPDARDADEPKPTREASGERRARDWIDAALDEEDEPDMASLPPALRTFRGMGLWAGGGG